MQSDRAYAHAPMAQSDGLQNRAHANRAGADGRQHADFGWGFIGWSQQTSVHPGLQINAGVLRCLASTGLHVG